MNVEAILAEIRYMFPVQAPIKDFIHRNILQEYQNHHFEEAIRMAGELCGANVYMPLNFYRQAYRDGKISDTRLDAQNPLVRKALLDFIEVKDETAFQHILAQKKLAPIKPELIFKHSKKIRPVRVDELGGDWDLQINPILFRLVSGFLDQGISLWAFPDTDLSFFECLANINTSSWAPIAHFVKPKRFAKWFEKSPEEVTLEILSKLVSEQHYKQYIADTLMAHPGWSGMVNVIEQKPSALLKPRSIRLVEFLALKLMLEWEFIQSHKTTIMEFKSLDSQTLSLALFLHSEGIKAETLDSNTLSKLNTISLGEIWHQAFESTYYAKSFEKIQTYAAPALENPAQVQAVFCIDDRECSLRRHLENLDPQIETFGVAGFFGIDFFFQSLNDAIPKQSCPVPLNPKHVVKERPTLAHHKEFERQKRNSEKTAISLQRWHDASGSMLLGFLAANTLGHLSFLRLIASFFKPSTLLRSLLSRQIDVSTELTLYRDEDEVSTGLLHQGFTHDEMTDRVFSVLVSMGFTKNFAPIVVMMAHGSSSANNPHFAAYDCGACSGKPGAPNARAFAAMANMPDVRTKLLEKGLDIPKSTRFVGAYHDTCTDHVSFFDTEGMSNKQRSIFQDFLVTLDKARGLNAKERCKRFALVKPNISAEKALLEVAHRASALFEPRPELGHTDNALCIIGPRSTTRKLLLDRRAFLNSYDPSIDEDGHILDQILSAAIPVCGGINLDYYFSRLDSGIYGCGTKLSHNVCALLGVYNGIDDDLRTGIPIQMTEIHEPIRLMAIVEQKVEIVDKVIRHNPVVFQWINHDWAKMACLDPSSKQIHLFHPGHGFEAL